MITQDQIEEWERDPEDERRARENRNFKTHDLWTPRESGAPRPVAEGGLCVCKRCGAGEVELYEMNCDDYAREKGTIRP